MTNGVCLEPLCASQLIINISSKIYFVVMLVRGALLRFSSIWAGLILMRWFMTQASCLYMVDHGLMVRDFFRYKGNFSLR
jgi:hypothetical protein